MNRQKHKEVSIEQLFWSYLSSKDEKQAEYREYMETELKINNSTRLDLFLLEVNSQDKDELSSIREQVLRKIKFQIFDAYFLIPLMNGHEILIGFIDTVDQLHIARFWEKRVLPEILSITECYLSSVCTYGLSELYDKVQRLRELNQYAFELGNELIITEDRVSKVKLIDITYPAKLENEAVLAIRNGDIKRTEGLCNQFLQEVVLQPAYGNRIKEYTVTFSEAVYNAIKAHLVVKQLEYPKLLMKSMMDSRTKNELIKCFEVIVSMLSEAEKLQIETENQIVMNAIAYIRNNYQTDITLTEVAEYVNISPEHLSRLFTQELGISFVIFLRNFRISIAKRMLASGKYKVKEIAEKVGYSDAKYFNKVFKSVCDMTPSEYQEKVVKNQ